MAFWTFTHDIEKQMQASGFASFQKVYQSFRPGIKSSSGTLAPDAGISVFTLQNRFLVLEVAHSRREKYVLRKARTYLLHTIHQIKIVLVVVVDKKPTSKGQIADVDTLSAATDTVHVHVCRYMLDTLEVDVKSLRIFPGPLPEDTFAITWSDVNNFPWNKTVESMGMPPETPEPVCHVNFHDLYWTAMRLADHVRAHLYVPPKFQPGEEDRANLKKLKYLPDV
jgi:hypothetical protein